MASFEIITQFDDDPGHLLLGCTVKVEHEEEPRYYEQELIGIPTTTAARKKALQEYVDQMERDLNQIVQPEPEPDPEPSPTDPEPVSFEEESSQGPD